MGKKFDSNQCKVNLKLAINRLKLQKNKKDNLIKNQKREIAELLRSAKDESARIKVESVIREDFIIEAYEILELFCELLLARLGVIEIAKECPPDLREAVCTVIYAAPRTDIKELAIVRELLYVKFGKELAMDAMNNKDNCVNARVVHKLAVQTPENYLVFQYLNEIAKAHNVDWKAEFTTPDATPALTSVPAMTSAPLFPEPPKSVHASSPTPNANQVMFPSVPSGFASPAPMFPSVPPSVAPTSIPSFPDVPQVNATPSVPVPNFNFSVPGVNNDIPSGPSFSFPTPPNVGPSANNAPTFPDVPTFPSVPSNNSVATNQSHPEITNPPLDFPSPPKDDNSSGIPDFDDLTARFEKLKRRDL